MNSLTKTNLIIDILSKYGYNAFIKKESTVGKIADKFLGNGEYTQNINIDEKKENQYVELLWERHRLSLEIKKDFNKGPILGSVLSPKEADCFINELKETRDLIDEIEKIIHQ